MPKEKKRKKKDDTDKIETTVDSYTGEEKPVAEDADQFIEVVLEETDDRRGSNYLLNEESSMDSYAADADADAVSEQSAHYTEDEEFDDEDLEDELEDEDLEDDELDEDEEDDLDELEDDDELIDAEIEDEEDGNG